MAFRKKALTYKNYPTVLAYYVKRHRSRLRQVIGHQIIQQRWRGVNLRRSRASYTFYSLTPGRFTPDQLDSIQKILIRKFARLFRVWQVIRFTGMVTAKPNEIRMGKGKGAFSFWTRNLQSNTVLFELGFIKWFPKDYIFHVVRRLKAKVRFWLSLRICE